MYSTPKEVAVASQNGSKYDYHFILTELAKEFEEEVVCLGKKKGKYRAFSLPVTKKLKGLVKKGKKTKPKNHILQITVY